MMKGSNAVYTVSTSSLSNYRDNISAYVSKTIVEKPADDDMPVVKTSLYTAKTSTTTSSFSMTNALRNDKYMGGTASTHVMTDLFTATLGLADAQPLL